MVEGQVQLVAVFFPTTFDLNLSFIHDRVGGNLLDDLRAGGIGHLLTQHDLADLLCRIFLVHAGVAIDFHLQLNHGTQVGRYHEVRAVFLGKCGGISLGDSTLAFADKGSHRLAEVGFQHAFSIIQLVEFQTAQQTGINGLGSHDVFDEHVGFVMMFPRDFSKRGILAVILATANGFGVINGVLGLLTTHFLKRTSTEDVNRCVIAALSTDNRSILLLCFFELRDAEDRLCGKAAIVHHIAGCIVGISQTLHLYLLV